MSEKTCETCRWQHDLICKRYPPQMVLWPNDNQNPVIYFPTETQPAVSLGQWCDEHTPKDSPDD